MNLDNLVVFATYCDGSTAVVGSGNISSIGALVEEGLRQYGCAGCAISIADAADVRTATDSEGITQTKMKGA